MLGRRPRDNEGQSYTHKVKEDMSLTLVSISRQPTDLINVETRYTTHWGPLTHDCYDRKLEGARASFLHMRFHNLRLA